MLNPLYHRGRFTCLLLILLSGLFSCETGIEIFSGGDPLPVVYCVLNQESEVQFVRIGRSFQSGLDANIPSMSIDSTVWNQNYDVYLEEYTGNQITNTFRFLPDENIRKDTGLFPVGNLRIFSSPFKPIPGKNYQLYVYFPDLRKMVSANTKVHGAPEIHDPLALSARKINFEPGQPFIIHWNPGMDTGVYEMIFRIHYRDTSAFGQEFHYADYSSGGIFDQRENQMLDYSMGGPGFFASMKKEIPVIPGVEREVISVEFIMVSGCVDLGFHYRSMIETGNLFSNLADYSNIGNGLGIFCSRLKTKVSNLKLSNVTLDELAHGEVTRELGFKDSKGE